MRIYQLLIQIGMMVCGICSFASLASAQWLFSTSAETKPFLQAAENLEEFSDRLQAGGRLGQTVTGGVNSLGIWFSYADNVVMTSNQKRTLEEMIRKGIEEAQVSLRLCSACLEIETKEINKKLVIRRLFADPEQRKEIAMTLGVQAFVWVSVLYEQGLPTLRFNIYLADPGENPDPFDSISVQASPNWKEVYAGVFFMGLDYEATEDDLTNNRREDHNASLVSFGPIAGLKIPVYRLLSGDFVTDVVANGMVFLSRTQGLTSVYSEFKDSEEILGVIGEGGLHTKWERFALSASVGWMGASAINNPLFFRLGGQMKLTPNFQLHVSTLIPLNSDKIPKLTEAYLFALGTRWP